MDLLEGLRELGVVVVLKLDLLGGGHGGQGHDARDEDGTSRQHAEHMGEEDRKESPLSVALGGRSTNEWKKQDQIRGEKGKGDQPDQPADGGGAMLGRQHP